MKRLGPIIEGITDVVSGRFPALLVLVLMCLILVEVTARYVFDFPLNVADEFGSLLFIAIVLIGLAYAWKEKSHVRIEVVTGRLAPKAREWLRFITLIIGIALVVVLLVTSVDMVATSIRYWSRSMTWLGLPRVYPQSPFILGYFLLLLRMIYEAFQTGTNIKTRGGKTG